VTGYVVTPYVGTTALASRAFPSTATTQTVTGLTNGTTYTFKVAAVNGVGTSGTSPASNAVTPATVPGQPTIKTAVPGNGKVTLSWTPPTSNGGSPITKYVVIVSIDGVSQGWHNFNSTASTQVVSGLSNGTTYTFQVMAQNAIGLGVPSPASTAVTPSVAPYEPFASWSALVDRQFLDITAKLPTSSQRSSWVNQLSNGTRSKGDLVDALRRGPENLANVDPVVRVYRAFLGRAPDAGGLKFWINRKRSIAPAKTWTVTQIATEFTNSNEFKTKYGSLTNRQFVTQIYTDVLGRPADAAGRELLDRQDRLQAEDQGPSHGRLLRIQRVQDQAGPEHRRRRRLHLPARPSPDCGRSPGLDQSPEGRRHPRQPPHRAPQHSGVCHPHRRLALQLASHAGASESCR
jgi:hypothetical protein